MTKFSTYRRRTIAKVKETIGVAKDITHDTAFENGYAEFQTYAEEMMEIGAVAHVYLEQAKIWTTTTEQMATNFNAYFKDGEFGETSQKFLSSNTEISNVIRKSVAIVALEQCLNPLRTFCSEKIADVERRVVERNNLRSDYDTYRRRLNDLQNKNDREKLEQTREKLERAKSGYEKINSELINEFKSMNASKENLLLNQATAMMICQLEFHSRATKSLEAALQSVVGKSAGALKTEKAIEQFIRSGGPDPAATAKAMQTNRESFKIAGPMFTSAGQDRDSFKDYGGNPLFAGQQLTASRRLPPPPPLPGGPSSNPVAVATFPFDPREEGEIGFNVGDKIEVLQQDSSGWWVGIANGKKGQFPANYVQLQ